MPVKTDTQVARILAVLADGAWHTVADIHRRAGYSRLNSRISQLRSQGNDIVCEHVDGQTGIKGYRYRWLNAPTPTCPIPEVLHFNDHAPRSPEERFRIYRLKAGAVLELVATTPTLEGVISALCRLQSEGEFENTTPGVLDGTRGDNSLTGEWIANPWAIEKDGINGH